MTASAGERVPRAEVVQMGGRVTCVLVSLCALLLASIVGGAVSGKVEEETIRRATLIMKTAFKDKMFECAEKCHRARTFEVCINGAVDAGEDTRFLEVR